MTPDQARVVCHGTHATERVATSGRLIVLLRLDGLPYVVTESGYHYPAPDVSFVGPGAAVEGRTRSNVWRSTDYLAASKRYLQIKAWRVA
jgi:hypothetical protein